MRLSFLRLVVAAPALALAQVNWETPYPAHTIAGNLHYIGTADLACYLITTPEGHIVINTGLASSVAQMREGAAQLGFRLEDARILLIMQSHFDHTEGLAELQKRTGARVFATEADAPILEAGGDGSFGGRNRFAPVKVDRRLRDGDRIRLGGTELTVVLSPGHSPGAVSYTLTVNDGGQSRRVAIVNLPTVVLPLVGNQAYPKIAADFERAFRSLKKLAPEIWVAGHASQFGMEAKHKAGSFVDPEGYRQALAHYENLFRQKLAAERRGR